MSQHLISCYKCRQSWTYQPPLGRKDECPHCRSDAKVCLNCRFYDPGVYRECREEQAEWVKEKNRGNFCSYFEPLASHDGTATELNKAKSKLDQLFGGGGQTEPAKPGASLADELKRFLDSKK